MSSFTQFDGELNIGYDRRASKILGKDYWRVTAFFRYFIGGKSSNLYVDVNPGKLTDGASVPFPFSILLPVWSDYGQAIVMHDQLCDTYTAMLKSGDTVTAVRLTRKEIDDALIEALEVLKVVKWRRVLIKAGLAVYRFIFNPTKPKSNRIKFDLEAQYSLS